MEPITQEDEASSPIRPMTPPQLPPSRAQNPEPTPTPDKTKDKDKDKETGKAKTINRISNKERDLLKESVARRERIAVLENKRRQVRNQKQYVRRQQESVMNGLGLGLGLGAREGGREKKNAVASSPDPPSSSPQPLQWKNVGLISVGVLAAGMLALNYSK